MYRPARPGQQTSFGTLTLTCVGGKDLPVQNSGLYVRFSVGVSQQNTSTRNQGGNPRWGDNFKFKVTNEKQLVVECFEKVKLSQDKLIGKTTVTLQNWIAQRKFHGNLDLVDDQNGAAGTIEVDASYEMAGQRAPLGLPQRKGPGQKMGGPGQRTNEPARDPNGRFTDQEIKEAFQAFDLDNNSFVGAAEIKHVLINIGEQPEDEEVDEMIRMVDKDGDGQVCFEEFYEMVTGGRKPPAGLWTGPGGGGGGAPNTAAPGAPPGAPGQPTVTTTLQQRKNKQMGLDTFAKEHNIKPESIKRAYKRFRVTDKDGSGQIDYTEFCEVLQVDPAPQVEKLFQLFDKDRSGQIDVREFMIGLSNFTGAGKEEKLKFAFMVFDEDGNGVITKQELVKILKANHMASTDKEVMRKADTIMAQADKDGDGVVDYDEFVLISKKFPNILFPAFSLSHQLGKKLGF